MSEENIDAQMPLKTSVVSESGNDGELPTGSVPVRPPQRTQGGGAVSPPERVIPPKDISAGKPRTGPLVYGLAALAAVSMGGAAYAFYSRYPIPSESDLQSGNGPIVELIRAKVEAMEKANAKEVSDLQTESKGKLQALETASRSEQARQAGELKKLNADIKLKEEEIKGIQGKQEEQNAAHGRELAANQSKVDELEKNAQSEQDRLKAEIDKLRVEIDKSKAKPITVKTVNPETPQAVPKVVSKAIPQAAVGIGHSSPDLNPVERKSAQPTERLQTWGRIGYGLDTKKESQYWFAIAQDGSTTSRYPSRELAIAAGAAGEFTSAPRRCP